MQITSDVVVRIACRDNIWRAFCGTCIITVSDSMNIFVLFQHVTVNYAKVAHESDNCLQKHMGQGIQERTK